MTRVSQHFDLGLSQPQLDFVDVKIETDTPQGKEMRVIGVADDGSEPRSPSACFDWPGRQHRRHVPTIRRRGHAGDAGLELGEVVDRVVH